jgi:hypothetical protein
MGGIFDGDQFRRNFWSDTASRTRWQPAKSTQCEKLNGPDRTQRALDTSPRFWDNPRLPVFSGQLVAPGAHAVRRGRANSSRKDDAMAQTASRFRWTLALLPILATGCALMDTGRNWWTGKRTDQSEPELTDDKWTTIGREMRSHRRADKEDPLDRLLWSEKAREINRNVGFE